MNSYSNHDSEEARTSQRESGHEHLLRQAASGPEAGMPQLSRGLIGSASLNNRHNAPVRAAAMRSMQQTHGNRAVQRFLQHGNTGVAGPESKEDDQLARRIEAQSGSGGKLPAEALMRLEDGLGADMSGVRIHTGSEADSLARQMSAVAFTTGQDIFFREGTYDPYSSEGLRLLAHEASHTVQQAAGPVSGDAALGGVSISNPQDAFEQEAERVGDAVATQDSTKINSVPAVTSHADSTGIKGSGLAVQRDEAKKPHESYTERYMNWLLGPAMPATDEKGNTTDSMGTTLLRAGYAGTVGLAGTAVGLPYTHLADAVYDIGEPMVKSAQDRLGYGSPDEGRTGLSDEGISDETGVSMPVDPICAEDPSRMECVTEPYPTYEEELRSSGY